jgi:hypothetical protein
MATIKYGAPGSPANVMTTELNAIANAAGAITATALSNDAAGELHPYATFELYLATQGTARVAGATVSMYILAELSDNYQYGGASLRPNCAPDAIFYFDAAVTARYAVAKNVSLPPTNFHVVLWNETGQTLAATGNILSCEVFDWSSE